MALLAVTMGLGRSLECKTGDGGGTTCTCTNNSTGHVYKTFTSSTMCSASDIAACDGS
jgi:hypothetical protein